MNTSLPTTQRIPKQSKESTRTKKTKNDINQLKTKLTKTQTRKQNQNKVPIEE